MVEGSRAEDRKPLRGSRIVVTRPRKQATEFVKALEELGAEVLLIPLISVIDPQEPEALRAAVLDADHFDWIVFTSANAVTRFWDVVEAAGDEGPKLDRVAICTVGPATAAAVEARGGRAELLPEKYLGEGVVEALRGSGDLSGRRVLFPRAEGARSLVPDALRSLGAEVVDVVAYRTIPDREAAEELRRILLDGGADVVTFTSSSAVREFVETVGIDTGAAKVATIGPITSATARAAGLRVDLEAEPFTTLGLVATIAGAAG